MSVASYYNPTLRARLAKGDVPLWLIRHPRGRYIIAAVLSYPPWVTREWINSMRDRTREWTAKTGVRHVLDHVIPLNHPRICGLTVPENMAIITWKENAFKSNNWCPDQLELAL